MTPSAAERRRQHVSRVALGKHLAHPARVLEQVERTGDAALRQQRRLHAVLRHQRVGDRLGGGDVAEAHRGRGRRARSAERNGVRQPRPVEPDQAAGHRRRREPRDGHAVPGGIALHQFLGSAENLVAEHDGGDDLAPRRAGKLAGRERHRDVVAGMAAEIAGLGADIVVEIEDADQRAVGERGIGRAGAVRAADHGALRRTTGRGHHRKQRLRRFLVERREATADGVEQEQLRLGHGGLGQVLRAHAEHPRCELLDRPRRLDHVPAQC